MNKDMTRLLWLLAAMELSKGEIMDLLHELRSMSVKEVYERIALYRSKMEFGVPVYRDDLRFSYKKNVTSTTVGDRVSQLLKHEAGLRTQEAVDHLSSLLVSNGIIEESELPALSRKSLSDWVNRLAQYVTEKEILRYATILRNEYVHSPKADWDLSGGKKP